MPYTERRIASGVEVSPATGRGGPTRILPDACLDLILAGDRLLVAGPDTTARMHSSDQASVLVGVRLHAGRAPHLPGQPTT